jgi:hypothetical protein
METRDWITVCSVAIIVVGWFVNSLLNRRHEIAKKRMEYRLDALLSFLPVLFAIQENRTKDEKFAKDLGATRTKFQFYCYRKEVEAYESMVAAIEAQDHKAYTDAVREIARMVKDRVRKELGLDKYDI